MIKCIVLDFEVVWLGYGLKMSYDRYRKDSFENFVVLLISIVFIYLRLVFVF